jgi:agmatine deiminase
MNESSSSPLDAGKKKVFQQALDSRPAIRKDQVRIAHIPYNDSWVRDTGPIFVQGPDGLIAQDFRFNAWGSKYEPWDDDDRLADQFCRMFEFPCQRHADFVLEGGSIDINGQGTLLTTRQCLLNPNRNPQLDQDGIEEVLKQSLGIERILWLNEGIEGDDTDGHIDDIARFVAPSRILTTLAHDQSDANYDALKENHAALKQMGDQDGNQLEIVDIPTPDLNLQGPFGPCPATYANFYIGNNVVLVPVFGAPNQESVLSVFRDLFPAHSIAPIDCTGLVCGLGAIHCITQQVPTA